MKTASACRSAREALHASYRRKIEINPRLNRSLVSYQSNRRRPFYRWFKYKEGFSASLVEYVLHHVGRCGGTLLDPFAGSGAALFAGRELGWTASGIELLPVGIAAFQARLAAGSVDATRFASAVAGVKSRAWKYTAKPGFAFQHLRITEGAFPAQTEDLLARYRTYIHDEVQDADVRRLLDFAAFSVLEAVSFTRKDGQYL